MARINTNISALTAQRNLNSSYASLNTTMEHLATGLRISRGKDDPAGLIVSERLRAEISAVGQAISNTQRAKLIVSTAEGALDEVATLLKDIQTKVVEAANEGAFSEDEIRANQLQIDSAIDSITRIANTTSFAGRKLLDGSLSYTTSGIDSDAVRTLQVHSVQFGSRTTVPVNIEVQTAAEQAELQFPYGALAAGASTVTIELAGPKGVTTMTFANGTAASAIANAIVAEADATGVSATVSATATSGFRLYSRTYGSSEFVRIRVLSESPSDFPTTGGTNGKEDYGTDAVATINGSLAGADGNHLTIKNSALDLEFNAAASAYTTSFNITGGGALFQVGPEVNTNLQVNLGIDAVNASHLGTDEIGFLSQLKTGQDYALSEQEYARASEILSKAINQVSMVRGRLGSFERNTLDTNMNQLTITKENLTSAESAIRDADFAYETSRLARDQVMVNAGTTILTLANQTNQSVLRLLGG